MWAPRYFAPRYFAPRYWADGDAPTWEQEGARWRADDGNEAGASWLAAQDLNITRAQNLTTRIRILLAAGGNPDAAQMQLEFRRVGDSVWQKIT